MQMYVSRNNKKKTQALPHSITKMKMFSDDDAEAADPDATIGGSDSD